MEKNAVVNVFDLLDRLGLRGDGHIGEKNGTVEEDGVILVGDLIKAIRMVGTGVGNGGCCAKCKKLHIVNGNTVWAICQERGIVFNSGKNSVEITVCKEFER